MTQFAFDVPDEELSRVATAFCEMSGHAPCSNPECLIGNVSRMAVARVTAHEKLKAARQAEAGVLPLIIIPSFTPS